MTPPAAPPQEGLGAIMLRSVKMHGMAQAVAELMEQGSPAFEAAVPIPSQLLKAELAEREVRSIAYHMKAARFPAYKDLSGFDFAASEVNEATVRQLHKGGFLDAAENVVLIGGPGTGKTHVATAIGVQLIEQRFNPLWADRLSGVEVWNRKSDGLATFSRAWDISLAHELPPVTGVDFHSAKQIWQSFMLFDLPDGGELDEKTAIAALRDRRVRPAWGKRPLLDGSGELETALFRRMDRL